MLKRVENDLRMAQNRSHLDRAKKTRYRLVNDRAQEINANES